MPRCSGGTSGWRIVQPRTCTSATTVSAHGTSGRTSGARTSGAVTTESGTWPSESTVLSGPIIGSSTQPRAATRSVTRPVIRRA